MQKQDNLSFGFDCGKTTDADKNIKLTSASEIDISKDEFGSAKSNFYLNRFK